MKQNVRFRNSFMIVIEKLLSMWLVFVWLIVELIGNESLKDKIIMATIIGGIILVVLIANIIMWRKTLFSFDENAIIVEKNGIFSKNRKTIAIANIATVNINRSILEAVLGVRTVKVDTNSSAAVEAEVSLCLKSSDAEAFQKTIMDMINGIEHEDEIQEEVVLQEEVKSVRKTANVSEMFMHCVYTMRIVEIIMVAIISALFILTEAEIEEGDSLGGAMGIISIIILVVGLVVSMIKPFLAYFNLEAVRKGNELTISYGFFDKKTYRIPINKVVAITIREPMVGRIFKKAYAEIVCVGMGDEEKELNLLSLCMDKKQLADKINALLPEFIPKEMVEPQNIYDIKREEKKALWVHIGLSIIYMLCVVVGAIIGASIFIDELSKLLTILAIVVGLICLIIFIIGLMKNSASGYSMDDKFMRVANGAFNKSLKIIPYKKMEYIAIEKTLVYKLFGYGRTNIFTKSGSVLDIVTNTCYINDKDMEIIKEKYRESYKRKGVA